MFAELDEDGSGDISLNEFLKGMDTNESMAEQINKLLGNVNPKDIFLMLDTDGGGEITVDEFCEAMVKCVESDKPMELTRILKLTKPLP